MVGRARGFPKGGASHGPEMQLHAIMAATRAKVLIAFDVPGR